MKVLAYSLFAAILCLACTPESSERARPGRQLRTHVQLRIEAAARGAHLHRVQAGGDWLVSVTTEGSPALQPLRIYAIPAASVPAGSTVIRIPETAPEAEASAVAAAMLGHPDTRLLAYLAKVPANLTLPEGMGIRIPADHALFVEVPGGEDHGIASGSIVLGFVNTVERKVVPVLLEKGAPGLPDTPHLVQYRGFLDPGMRLVWFALLQPDMLTQVAMEYDQRTLQLGQGPGIIRQMFVPWTQAPDSGYRVPVHLDCLYETSGDESEQHICGLFGYLVGP